MSKKLATLLTWLEVNPFSAVAKLLMAVIFLEYWQRACNCRPTLPAQRKRSRVNDLLPVQLGLVMMLSVFRRI